MISWLQVAVSMLYCKEITQGQKHWQWEDEFEQSTRGNCCLPAGGNGSVTQLQGKYSLEHWCKEYRFRTLGKKAEKTQGAMSGLKVLSTKRRRNNKVLFYQRAI